MRLIALPLAALTAGALMVGTTVPANAEKTPAPEPVKVKLAQPQNIGMSKEGAATVSAGMYEVEGLDEGVVRDYGRFITAQPDGHFKATIPAANYFTDASRAWAATNAVTRANLLIDQQRAELRRHGYSQQQIKGKWAVESRVASKLLPMGEHATFQADWWGMTFTLDKVATAEFMNALDFTQDITKLIASLSSLGIVFAEPVTAILSAVLKVVTLTMDLLKKCVNEDGMVIKSLWVPVPWCEQPTHAFVPAPMDDQKLAAGIGAVRSGSVRVG